MSKDQTTTTTNEPFSGVTADRFNTLYSFLNNRLNNVPQYSAPLSASLNQTQQGAINKLASYANNPTLSAYASGNYIDPTQNPYVQNMASQIKKDVAGSWGTMGDQINTAANKTGFMSGSGRFKSLADTQKDLSEAESGALANLYNSAYQQGVGNMFQAGQQQQGAAEAALQAGNTQYQAEDTAAQRAYQDFLRQQGYTQDQINNILNYFSIGKNPSQTSTTSDNGSGALSTFGSLIACFPTGVMVEVPAGRLPIEQAVEGMTVITPTGEGKVIGRDGPYKQSLLWIVTDSCRVPTTATQGMVTPEGIKLVVELSVGDPVVTRAGTKIIREIVPGEEADVYDITVDGDNVFYANGFAVEGGF